MFSLARFISFTDAPIPPSIQIRMSSNVSNIRLVAQSLSFFLEIKCHIDDFVIGFFQARNSSLRLSRLCLAFSKLSIVSRILLPMAFVVVARRDIALLIAFMVIEFSMIDW